MSEIILRVENVTKKFPVAGGKFLTACDKNPQAEYTKTLLAAVPEIGGRRYV